jgi:hypothetical protein
MSELSIPPLQELLDLPAYGTLAPEKKLEAIRNWEKESIKARNTSGDWSQTDYEQFEVETRQAKQRALGVEPQPPDVIKKSLLVEKAEQDKIDGIREALTEVSAAKREQREIDRRRVFPWMREEGDATRVNELTGQIERVTSEVGEQNLREAQMASDVLDGKRDATVFRGKVVVNPDLYFDRDRFVAAVNGASATEKEKAKALATFYRGREAVADAMLPTLQGLGAFRQFANEFTATNPDATKGQVVEEFRRSGRGEGEKWFNALSTGWLSAMEGVGYLGFGAAKISEKVGELYERVGLTKTGQNIQQTAQRAQQEILTNPVLSLQETAEAKQQMGEQARALGGYSTAQEFGTVGGQLAGQLALTMLTGGAGSAAKAVLGQAAKGAATTAVAEEMAKSGVKKWTKEYVKNLVGPVGTFAGASSAGPVLFEAYQGARTQLAAEGLVGEELEAAARSEALTKAVRADIITRSITALFGTNGAESVAKLTQVAANPAARAALKKTAMEYAEEVGKGTVGEFFEESLDEGINGGLDALLENPDMTFDDWVKSTAFAGTAGALFGGTSQAVTNLAEAAVNGVRTSPVMEARRAAVENLRSAGLPETAAAMEEANAVAEQEAIDLAINEIEANMEQDVTRLTELDEALASIPDGDARRDTLVAERDEINARMTNQAETLRNYDPVATANVAVADLVDTGMDVTEAREAVTAVVNRKYSRVPVSPEALVAEVVSQNTPSGEQQTELSLTGEQQTTTPQANEEGMLQTNAEAGQTGQALQEVTPVTPVPATPSFRAIVGRPVTVDGEGGEIRIDEEDGTVLLDREGQTPIILSRNADQSITESEFAIQIDEEAERDAEQARVLRTTIGGRPTSRPIERPAPRSTFVREDGAIVTNSTVTDFVGEGETEAGDLFVTVRDRQGNEFELHGNDALAVAIARRDTARDADLDTAIETTVTQVAGPTLDFDRVLTRLVGPKTALLEVTTRDKRSTKGITRETVDRALDELTELETQIQNENFPDDIRTSLLDIVNDAFDDVAQVSQRIPRTPASDTTPARTAPAGGTEATVEPAPQAGEVTTDVAPTPDTNLPDQGVPTEAPAGEVTTPPAATPGETTGKVPRSSQALVASLNRMGVSVHFTTSSQLAALTAEHGAPVDINAGKVFGSTRSGLFTDRSGTPRIYVLTDNSNNTRKTLLHEARHAANAMGKKANPEAHAAAVAALQNSPDLLKAAAKKYPGFAKLSPERQLSEVLSMIADGKLDSRTIPSEIMRFVEAVLAALRGSVLVSEVSEINGYFADLSALLAANPVPATPALDTETARIALEATGNNPAARAEIVGALTPEQRAELGVDESVNMPDSPGMPQLDSPGMTRRQEALDAGLDRRTADGLGAAVDLGNMMRELAARTPEQVRQDHVRIIEEDMDRFPKGAPLHGSAFEVFIPAGGQQVDVRRKGGKIEVVAGDPSWTPAGEPKPKQAFKKGVVIETFDSTRALVDRIRGPVPDVTPPAETPTQEDQSPVDPVPLDASPVGPRTSTTPEGKRHAELEAKFNAGTITPEETAEAQRLVEQRAKESGLQKAYRGQDTDGAPRITEAEDDYPGIFYAEGEKHASFYGPLVSPAFLDLGPRPKEVTVKEWGAGIAPGEETSVVIESQGTQDSFPSLSGTLFPTRTFVVRDPNQIKSAEPFTGVPLDERFNPASDSILETAPQLSYTPDSEWGEVVNILVNRALAKYPGLNATIDTTIPTPARTLGIQIAVNPVEMATYTAGMSEADAAATIDKIFRHEATHRHAVAEVGDQTVRDFANAMTADERLDVASHYLHRSAYPTDEAWMKAVDDFTGDNPNMSEGERRVRRYRLGHEALRMRVERFTTGFTTEEDLAFMQMNPGNFARFVRYLRSYLNRLREWLAARKDPVIGVEVKRLARLLDTIENGPQVDRGEAPFSLGTSPTEMSPSDARYLELAKDPEANREELQRMVDEAARAAGYTVGPVWHGTNQNITEFEARVGPRTAGEGPDVKPAIHFSANRKVSEGAAMLASNFGRNGKPVVKSYYLKGAELRSDVSTDEEYRVENPNQIKSADPITYDESGNVIPLSHRFNPESDSILYAARRGFYNRPKAGTYRAGGAFSAAGWWDQRLYKMLEASRGAYQAEMKMVEIWTRQISRAVKTAFKADPAAGFALVNTALGNVDNRLTEADVAAIKDIKKKGLASAQSAYMTARAQANQLDAAGMRADAALARQDAKVAFNAAVAAYKQAATDYENTARANARNLARVNQANALAQLPVEIQETVKDLRSRVDQLSNRMISEGNLSDELKATITENQGLWLHRSYEIFDDPNYSTWIREQRDPEAVKRRNRAVTYIRSDLERREAAKLIGKGMNPTAAKVQAKANVTDAIVQDVLEDYLMVADGGSKHLITGSTVSKETAALMKRGTIPQEIMELWGRYDDPAVNAAKSIAAVSQFLSINQFFHEVLTQGEADGWLIKPTAGVPKQDRQGNRLVELFPDGTTGRFGNTASNQYAPLAGYWGPAELAEALKQTIDDRGGHKWVQAFVALTGYSMASKTALSIQSLNRNFLGNILPTILNGNMTVVRPGTYKKAARLSAIHMNRLIGGDTTLALTGGPATKAELAEVERLVALGVLGDNVTQNLINELTGGLGSDKKAIGLKAKIMGAKWISKAVTNPAKALYDNAGRAYSVPDDFWKVVNFYGEQTRVKEFRPSATQDAIDKEAAEIVKTTMPTYSRAPEVVKFLRRQPILAPFITFPSEMVRISYGQMMTGVNQIKEGQRTGNKALRKAGLLRTFWLGVLGASFYSVPMVMRGILGFDQEDEDDLREHLAPWQKNATIMLLPSEDRSKGINYMDVSYMNPYDVLFRPIRSIMKNLRDDDVTGSQVALDAVMEAADPVLSEQILLSAILDARAGKTATGRPIWEEKDDPITKLTKSVAHVTQQALTPGTITTGQRIFKAADAQVSPSGMSYELANELSAVLGPRVSTLDVKTTMRIAGGQFRGDTLDARNVFTRVVKSRGTQDADAILSSYVEADELMFRAFRDLREKYVGAIELGTMTRAEAIQSLTNSGLSKAALGDLLANRYRRIELRREDLADVKREGEKLGQDRVSLYRQAIDSVPPIRPISEDTRQ